MLYNGKHMDSKDVIDEVNALLKLDVGDPYRLEHIKQTFIQNKKIWITDENYLKNLRDKYLVKHTSDVPTDEIVFENEPENKETIHCWKCGKKGPLGANFCMLCGSSLFEVGANSQPVSESKSSSSFTSIPLKIPIIIGIPILILIILGAGYSLGYFDDALDSSPDTISTPVVEMKIFSMVNLIQNAVLELFLILKQMHVELAVVKTTSSGETDSKCGPGTVFDSESNSCVLG